jgi:large conductance mechanosensitive channel
MLKEFKEFAAKERLDMAVGIIIRAAFGPIVKSLVNDVIMPPIGLLLGNVDFSTSSPFSRRARRQGAPSIAAASSRAITLNFGLFVNAIINFSSSPLPSLFW